MIQFLSANQVAIMPKATVGSSYVYFGIRPDPFINALLNKQRKQTLPHRREAPSGHSGRKTKKKKDMESGMAILCLWECNPLGEILANHVNFLSKRIRDEELVSRGNSTQL